MPELPEVETTRRGIAPHVEGRKVKKLEIFEPRLRWPIPSELPALVKGRKVLEVSRRGKYLLLRFSHGTALAHLGMSGSLRVVSSGEARRSHDHVDWHIGSQILRFNDPRRFGALLWTEGDVNEHPLLRELGPEPLSEEFDADYLFGRCRKRKQAIKTLIMDSKIVVGVGNIYANEALFMAGIHPNRPAGRISYERLQVLVSCIRQVLAAAITQGGTTLRDFVGGDGKPGYFAQKLRVYGRAGQACQQCGALLKELRLGQRSTVYCGACQR